MEIVINQIKLVAPLLIAAEEQHPAFNAWQKATPLLAKQLIAIHAWLQDIYRIKAHALLAIRGVCAMDENDLITVYHDKWIAALKALPNVTLIKQMLSTDNYLQRQLQEKIIPALKPLLTSYCEYADIPESAEAEQVMLTARLQKIIQDVCSYEKNLFKGMDQAGAKVTVVDHFYEHIFKAIESICVSHPTSLDTIRDELMAHIDKQVRTFQSEQQDKQEIDKYALHLGITLKNVLLMLLATTTIQRENKEKASALKTPKATTTDLVANRVFNLKKGRHLLQQE